MDIQYKKAKAVVLSEVGKDEKWLQNEINNDPTILGLGDLVVIRKEKTQSAGGRIDFLMRDQEDDGIRYEVEVMLGTLDESHIIRTIEYWDMERRRYPELEHRAVIVAEDITNRFFNVIGLLNKAVPIIAIQLNAFVLEKTLLMNFVKVLDLTGEEDEEPVDRAYWESSAGAKSLEIMDALINMVASKWGNSRVTYNKGHVALGTSGYNFCWFHHRKGSHAHLHLKTGASGRDSVIARLQDKGIKCSRVKDEEIAVVLTEKELVDHKDAVQEALAVAEKFSRR